MKNDIYKITTPPDAPKLLDDYYLPGQSGIPVAPYFVHLHFKGFIYGLAAPPEVIGIKHRDKSSFETWLKAYVDQNILPQTKTIGSENRLLLLKISDAGPTIAHITDYQPVPETTIFDFDQAIEFFYFPPIWIHSTPVQVDGNVDFDQMDQRVFLETLPKCKIKIAATEDGQFTFDFSDWPVGAIPPIEAASKFEPDVSKKGAKIKGLRLSVINTFLTLLRSACVKNSVYIHSPVAVSPQRIHSRRAIDAPGGGSVRAMFGLDSARSPHGYRQDLPHRLDWRIADRMVIEPIKLDVLHQACSDLDMILELPIEKGLSRVELYGHACLAFEENNFSLCLAQAWLAIESLLTELWEKHIYGKDRKLEDGKDLLNKERKSRLFGADFTTSMTSELLLVEGALPEKLYFAIKPVRSARNKWIHGLEAPDMDLAKNALDILEELLVFVCSINLKIYHSASHSF